MRHNCSFKLTGSLLLFSSACYMHVAIGDEQPQLCVCTASASIRAVRVDGYLMSNESLQARHSKTVRNHTDKG